VNARRLTIAVFLLVAYGLLVESGRDRGQAERRSCASRHDDDRQRAWGASITPSQDARLGCRTMRLPRDKGPTCDLADAENG
jgi:hypothetical protein